MEYISSVLLLVRVRVRVRVREKGKEFESICISRRLLPE